MNTTTQHKQVVVNNDSLRVISKLSGHKKGVRYTINASDLIRECMKGVK